jgi:hypothetical protein
LFVPAAGANSLYKYGRVTEILYLGGLTASLAALTNDLC